MSYSTIMTVACIIMGIVMFCAWWDINPFDKD